MAKTKFNLYAYSCLADIYGNPYHFVEVFNTKTGERVYFSGQQWSDYDSFRGEHWLKLAQALHPRAFAVKDQQGSQRDYFDKRQKARDRFTACTVVFEEKRLPIRQFNQLLKSAAKK